MRILSALVGLVSRVPAPVQLKLLAAFLVIAFLLIMLGGVGLQVLSGVNQRAEELVKLQRKIEAYRQVQHDTTTQLYSVATALISVDEQAMSSTLRQLNQFGYDVDRLQFVAKDEVELLGKFRQDYDGFVEVVTRVVELIRAGRASEARVVQTAEAAPLADRLERLTNQLVNRAEADMVAGIEASKQAYNNSGLTVRQGVLSELALMLTSRAFQASQQSTTDPAITPAMAANLALYKQYTNQINAWQSEIAGHAPVVDLDIVGIAGSSPDIL